MYSQEVIQAAFWDWVNALLSCKRVSNNPAHWLAYPPLKNCNCKECEDWRESWRLHDRYRHLAGLPV